MSLVISEDGMCEERAMFHALLHFECGWMCLLSAPVQVLQFGIWQLWPSLRLSNGYHRIFLRGEADWDVKLTSHLHLVPRLTHPPMCLHCLVLKDRDFTVRCWYFFCHQLRVPLLIGSSNGVHYEFGPLTTICSSAVIITCWLMYLFSLPLSFCVSTIFFTNLLCYC